MTMVSEIRSESGATTPLDHLGRPRRWQARYAWITVVSDSVFIAASVALAELVTWNRLGRLAPVTLLAPVLWVILNAAFGGYDQRFIGIGS